MKHLILTLLLATTTVSLAEQDEATSRSENVWLDLALDATGAVTSVDVIDHQPPSIIGILEDWALQQQYEPAVIDGQPVTSTISIFATVNLEAHEEGVAVTVEGGEPQPRPITIRRPRFPQMAMRAGRGGSAKVKFVVDEEGRPTQIEVVESTDRAFEKPTIQAMEKWRFKVQTINGEPVTQEMTQTIEYNLEKRRRSD